MSEEQKPKKVLPLRRKKQQSTIEWRVIYRRTGRGKQGPYRRKPFFSERTIFWLKFFVYILLVGYVMRQCGAPL